MVMRAESLQRLSNVAAEISASLQESDLGTGASCFVVNGHSMVAVRHMEDGSRGGHSDHRQPVGRIMCAGTPYLIYDAVNVPAPASGLPPSAADILTRRELQIAMLITDGKLDKEIARQLGIS